VDVRVVKEFRAGSLGDDDLRFRGALGHTDKDALADTARRVALAADIAADHGVSLYLEPLAWSPINRVSQALQIFCDKVAELDDVLVASTLHNTVRMLLA
jgi:sugar phosphate isomerase/epimerase